MLYITRARLTKTSIYTRESPYILTGKPVIEGTGVHQGYSDTTVIVNVRFATEMRECLKGTRLSVTEAARGRCELGEIAQELCGRAGKRLERNCSH